MYSYLDYSNIDSIGTITNLPGNEVAASAPKVLVPKYRPNEALSEKAIPRELAREDFLSWVCAPTAAPTEAPTSYPCSAELSTLCYFSPDGNRECLSECNNNSCVNWRNNYNDIK